MGFPLLALAFGGAQLLGSGIQAYGQYEASKQNAKALDYNASMMQIQAADAMQRAAVDVADLRKQTAELQSAQTASYAAQGVDVSKGAPVALAEATDAAANEDARRIWRNATYQAWGLQTEASQTREQAARTKKGGRYAAMSTLFGGTVGGAKSALGSLGMV